MKTKLSPTVRLLLTILMCLPVWGSSLSAQEPYAVYDKATSTLTFKHDTKKPDGAFSLNKGYAPVGINTIIIFLIIMQISSKRLSSMPHLQKHAQRVATDGSMAVMN